MNATVAGVRDLVKGFGTVALVLVAVGLFLPSRWARTALVIGVVWGLANVLLAAREVSATVDVSGDPVITYPTTGGL